MSRADHGAVHRVDQAVGRRIRLRRHELGVSQEKLAGAVGVTFQQIQKYERAANRVSASKLFELSQALGVSPTYFFEGLAHEVGPASGAGRLELGAVLRDHPDLPELARLFPRMTAAERRRILELIRTLATTAGKRR